MKKKQQKGKVYLCGHTGSYNRGSSAIVITTAKIARSLWPDKQIILATFEPESDKALGVFQHFDDILIYCRDQFIYKALGFFFRKILKNDSLAFRIIQWNLLRKLTSDDIVLNVGGDIYCYPGAARTSYALIEETHRKKITSVFWGCSLEPKLIDEKMLHNLKQYSLIVARESITYKLLLKKGVSPEKIVLLPDPAFLLKAKKTALPQDFTKVIGINMSPLVLSSSQHATQLFKALQSLIHYIIEKTEYKVALIPHVYTPKGDEDALVNQQLKALFPNNKVVLFDKEYTAEELKYIISKCSLLVCARTHASIAAYSSGVPTLVLGYSTKSKGIAQDLFLRQEGYVLQASDITKDKLFHDFQTLLNQLEIEKEKLILKRKEIEKEFEDKTLRNKIIPKLNK